MGSLFYFISMSERGRLCYYKKDLDEFQTKRDSFTDPEKRAAFVKECKAIISDMEKVQCLWPCFLHRLLSLPY